MRTVRGFRQASIPWLPPKFSFFVLYWFLSTVSSWKLPRFKNRVVCWIISGFFAENLFDFGVKRQEMCFNFYVDLISPLLFLFLFSWLMYWTWICSLEICVAVLVRTLFRVFERTNYFKNYLLLLLNWNPGFWIVRFQLVRFYLFIYRDNRILLYVTVFGLNLFCMFRIIRVWFVFQLNPLLGLFGICLSHYYRVNYMYLRNCELWFFNYWGIHIFLLILRLLLWIWFRNVLNYI